MFNRNLINNEYVKKALFIFAVLAGGGVIVLTLLHLSEVISVITGFIGWTARIMTGFISGFVVAYLLLPVVKGLQGLLMKIGFFKDRPGAARGAALAVTYLLILFIIAAAVFSLALAITKQVQRIDYNDLPRLFRELELQAVGLMDALMKGLEDIGIATDGMVEWIDTMKDKLTGSLSSVGDGVLIFANGVGSFFSNALFTVIFSIYFLLETEGLCAYWSRAFRALFGEKVHGVLAILLGDVDQCFSGYIRGQFADAAFMAVAVGMVLTIIGVPYSVVIGIMSGIGNLIPYVGPIVAYGMVIIVCIAKGKWGLLAVGLVAIFILQTIDGNVVNPKLLSQSIDVHPVLVIVGLLFGSAVGGLAGMLLAVPVASFCKIQFERFVEYRLREKNSGKELKESPHAE